ncbi:unnamed protein product, partial [Durusdinium trenchii]
VTGDRSRVAENLGEVAAAAALEVIRCQDSKGSGSRVSVRSLPNLHAQEAHLTQVEATASKQSPTEARKAAEATAEAKAMLKSSEAEHCLLPKPSPSSPAVRCVRTAAGKCRRHRDGGKKLQLPGRPKAKELPWGTRESQVAHWLDNIRPRRP